MLVTLKLPTFAQAARVVLLLAWFGAWLPAIVWLTLNAVGVNAAFSTVLALFGLLYSGVITFEVVATYATRGSSALSPEVVVQPGTIGETVQRLKEQGVIRP